METKKVKTLIPLIIWIVLLILLPSIIIKIEDTQTKQNKSYISSDFNIEEYDITLDIDKDRKIDVTEVITVNITEDNFNGIYKSIPVWQQYYDENGQEKSKKVIITNLRATGEKFELKENSNNIGIQIGSKRTKVTPGFKTYVIKYRYNMGKDTNTNYDDLLFNIFENYDDTKIKNLSITLNSFGTLENIDVKFLKEKEDITKNINYTINEKTLTAKLDEYELDNKLTMNLKFKDNYFLGGTNNYGILCLSICVLLILICIGCYIAWLKNGKDYNKYSQTVEFYPPEGLDPAQIGYIYGEKSLKKLTTSLIISLAYKGYISIKKVNSQYEITNIGVNKKDLKPMSITEQIVYLELFEHNQDSVLTNNEIFSNIFTKVSTCLNEITNKKVNDTNSHKLMKTVSIILSLCVVVWTIAYLFIKDLNPTLNFLYPVSFIAIFLIGLFSIIMDRKTAYGEKIIARIKGFKDYLETAEKDTLNASVEKNPEYFYEILPYTYALGVSKIWIEKFEKQSVPNIDIDVLDSYEDGLFIVIT